MTSMFRRVIGLMGLVGVCLSGAAMAAPLSRNDLPAVLKDWLPWAMHGQETAWCPSPYNAEADKVCVWPARLALTVGAQGAGFRLEVQVFGATAMVALPGEGARWPQDVKADGRALAVAELDGHPAALLEPGRHIIEGHIVWSAVPPDLLLPKGIGSVVLSVDGAAVSRAPDAEGRLWLKQPPQADQGTDAVTVHTTRLLDDQVPLTVTTRYDIAVSGKAREIELPAALLPGLVPEGIDSALPARLQDEGKLLVQGRPGNWTVQVRGRLMSPVQALSLPKGTASPEEVWSFAGHNDVRMVSVEGVPSVDPKQVDMPDEWRVWPAYRLKPGDTMKLVQSRRGNPTPNPDSLKIERKIWLDFDGQGYTVQDNISGTLSRSSRLEMADPAQLGRASVDGQDQPITRLMADGPQGLEVRSGQAQLSADSRVASGARTLPATGWRADFNQAAAVLNLPPGWRLIHALGVDNAEGAWLTRWTLWDFFFVLLSALAAGRLVGLKSGLLLGAALVLSWHMPGAPQSLWLVLLSFHALVKVLPQGKLLALSTWGEVLTALMIALLLLPYAVDQVRLSMYPALERPWQTLGQGPADAQGGDDAAAPEPVAASPMQESSDRSEYSAYSSKRAAKPSPKVAAARLEELDPLAKVQTGPGLPNWQWNAHRLSWQGPVQQGQSMRLLLLPPAGVVVLRLGSLALLVAALISLVVKVPRRWPSWPAKGSGRDGQAGASAAAVMMVLLTALWALAPADVQAGEAAKAAAAPTPNASAPAPVAPPEPVVPPGQALLDELRAKLTAAPDCMPHCAEVPRLALSASGSRIVLRLEAHALADVALPLPGQGANWRPTVVMVDGKVAPTRRDDAGALWVALSKGVSQIVLEADVGSAASVDITLPMPVHAVTAQTDGWTLAPLDASGVGSGALSLSRTQAASQAPDQGTQRDALPPFVRVERTLHLGLRWTIDTQVVRVAPSLAPVRVRVRLLAGEAVNDAAVTVQDGVATLQLGAQESASFVSTLKEAPRLSLLSSTEPQQIELWKLDTSTQWHVKYSGIAPVVHQAGGRWMPTWQPWPGEHVSIEVSRPEGVAGQTLTIDRVGTTVSPGARATDVSALVSMRSSQGGNHRFELPPQAQLLSVVVDGQVLPVQQQGAAVMVPITPGAHVVKLDWREPRGMGLWFKTASLKVGTEGVNDVITVNMPMDRVVLAVGGPSVGPAVLFWGVFLVITAVAVGLGRLKVTPLRGVSWALLGLGVAQMSLLGMAVVAAWFLTLEGRRRMAPPASPRMFRLMQIALAVWSVLVAGVLLETVRVGLLGYPNLIVLGNGSEAAHLHWYADRLSQHTAPAWVASAPVYAYRIAMLFWALWLAASLLRWIKWAWECFSAGGYWPQESRVITAVEG